MTVLSDGPEYVSVARYSELCMNELALRLNDQAPVYDLGRERVSPIQDSNGRHAANAVWEEFIYATISRPVDGKVEHEARCLCFGTSEIMELKRTRL